MTLNAFRNIFTKKDYLYGIKRGRFLREFFRLDSYYHKFRERIIVMDELYAKLNAIPDSYFGFVMGIMSYAKQKPERLDNVLQFLNEASNPTSSDVVKFVMEQPDFHEYGLELKEMKD